MNRHRQKDSVNDLWEGRLVTVLSGLESTLTAKHNDYGDNLGEFGLKGILIRLSDKVSRLKTLLWEGREAQVKDEMITDTFRDIAGYAILALIMGEDKQ